MPFVNYVKENIAFLEYAADNNLRPNEILVWQALFHIMNQRSNGNYWPDGFIRVKNDRLLTYAPIGFDSLSRARNALAQRGLIAYKPGKKNSEVPMYELHYLTAVNNPQLHDEPVDNPVDNSFYPVSYPQNTDNIGGNMGGNMGGNIRDNMGGKLSHQIININNTESKRTKTFIDDEDDVDVGQPRGRARAYELCDGQYIDENDGLTEQDNALAAIAASAIRSNFGREATPAEARLLAVKARLSGFGPDMLSKALQLAAIHGARIPTAYISKIFEEWSFEQVTTPDEADEYQFMADARDGRNWYGSGDASEDFNRMKKAREERRAKHEAAKGGGEGGSHTATGI